MADRFYFSPVLEAHVHLVHWLKGSSDHLCPIKGINKKIRRAAITGLGNLSLSNRSIYKSYSWPRRPKEPL